MTNERWDFDGDPWSLNPWSATCHSHVREADITSGLHWSKSQITRSHRGAICLRPRTNAWEMSFLQHLLLPKSQSSRFYHFVEKTEFKEMVSKEKSGNEGICLSKGWGVYAHTRAYMSVALSPTGIWQRFWVLENSKLIGPSNWCKWGK